ncbi:MAG TPA: pseudouridine synthase, partial [Planctomycetota bacterium]|nr:pseudouridine synthase [Planctomycetota bacterium]
GVELEDGPSRPAEVRRLAPQDGRERIELVLREGRNRQVRRMLEAVGSRVATLERTAIGPLTLGDLVSGAWRALSRTELARLLRALPPAPRPATLRPRRRRSS